MIGPGTGVRVYLACGTTDMRKGIAGLAALAQLDEFSRGAAGLHDEMGRLVRATNARLSAARRRPQLPQYD